VAALNFVTETNALDDQQPLWQQLRFASPRVNPAQKIPIGCEFGAGNRFKTHKAIADETNRMQ